MTNLVSCAVCGGIVATSADHCIHCGAADFIPCQVCQAPSSYASLCHKHSVVLDCHYCGRKFYPNEGYECWITKWVWDQSYSQIHGPDNCMTWQVVRNPVCCSCSKKHPEPLRPRDKILGIF